MRIQFISAFIAVLALSCTAQNAETPVDNDDTRTVTLIAYAESDVNGGTKTVIEDGGKVFWSAQDAISLFYGSGENGGSKFLSNNTEPVSTAVFTGSINTVIGGGEGMDDSNLFWAVYPFDERNICTGHSIISVLEPNQQSAKGNFGPNQFPTMGKSAKLTMGFYNICGGIQFTLGREDIKSVCIKQNGATAIAGTFEASFDSNSRPAISKITDGSTSITVTPAEGGCFEKGAKYYAVIAPTLFGEGATVTYRTASMEGSYVIGNAFEIKRSEFLLLPERDLNLSYSPIQIHVQSIKLNRETLNLEVGKAATLIATIYPSDAFDKSVEWSSSDSTVATIDQGGKMTGRKEGLTTICVRTTDGGFSASCSVKVIKAGNGTETIGEDDEKYGWD